MFSIGQNNSTDLFTAELDGNGFVHFYGRLKNDTATGKAGNAAVIPEECRPGTDVRVYAGHASAGASINTFATLTFTAGGSLTTTAMNAGSYTNLNGISYKVGA